MSGRPAGAVALTIDGRRLEAPEGTFLLAVARAAGIEIPTLCEHPDLEPVGACRLCMVEVGHPDWKGWTGLMTACLYPVAEGIEVSTRSQAVQQARRQVLALIAARCPNAEDIRKLAARHGADGAHLAVDPAADDCILCGLCTRVCEAHATSAIATLERGATKAIGAFDHRAPEDCVGCGACALVCPTGHIHDARATRRYEIWERGFDVGVCAVEPARCLGCGACEEACPFNVARVAFQAGGQRVATIPPEHCRGCGACVGACPSGAIDQEHAGARGLVDLLPIRNGRAVSAVFACARTGLRGRELPRGVSLQELPCAGRVSPALLIAALAKGAEGALVLGRHQSTCRFDGAEDPARGCVERVDRALGLVGLGRERVRFVDPEPGPEGPQRAVTHFAEDLARLGANPVGGEGVPEDRFHGEGLDTSFDLLGWLSEQDGVVSNGHGWLAEEGLPSNGGSMLFAGDLPYLSLLAGPLLAPLDLTGVLRRSRELFERLGVRDLGLHVAGCGVITGDDAVALDRASSIYVLSEGDRELLAGAGLETIAAAVFIAARRPSPGLLGAAVACDGSAEAQALLGALRAKPIDVGPDFLPLGFSFAPAERLRAEERLQEAERQGAVALLVSDVHALVRWALVARQGTWRSSRVVPVLASQLAWFALLGRPLGVEFLENPPERLLSEKTT